MSKEVTNGREFNRTALLKVLTALCPGLVDKEDAEQSQSFVFDTDRIYTFNESIGICIPFDSGLKCAVPSVPILAVLRKIKNDDIMLSFNEGSLTVRQGKRVKVDITADAKILLAFDEHVKPPKDLIKLPCTPKEFTKGVKSVLFSVCDDTQKIQLCGVHLGSDKKGTYIESSDRFRMTRFYVAKEQLEVSMKIPLVAAQALCSLGPVQCAQYKGWLYFKCENDVLFACWTPKEDYPDLKAVFDSVTEKDTPVTITFPEKIEGILELASEFSTTGISKDAHVVVSVEGSKASVSSKGTYGKFRDLCKVVSEGTAKFVINPKSFIELLAMSLTIDVFPSIIVVKGKGFWHVATLSILPKEEE